MSRFGRLLGISSFWLGLSVLLDGLTTLVLPSHIDAVLGPQRRATLLGMVSCAGLLAGALVQPLAGAVSDRLRWRWGRRGTVGVGVALTLAALAAFGVSRSLATILAGYVAVQIAAAVSQASQQGFIPDLEPASRRGIAAGWKGFMDVGGAALGFVVLGQLLGRGHLRAALMAMAVALLSTFLLTVGLVKEPRGKRMTGRPHPGLLSAFHIETRRHRIFLRLVGSRFLFLLGTYGVGRFFLFYVEDRLGLGRAGAASQTGMLLGALALLTGLSSPPAGWAADRFGRLPLIRVGAFGSVVGVLGLVAAGSAAQLLLWGALMAVGSAAFAAGNWAFITDVVPPEEAGRFMGLANFGTAGAAAVAGLAGPLVDWGNGVSGGSGYIALFAVAACAFGASALALRGIDRTVSAGRMVEVAAG